MVDVLETNPNPPKKKAVRKSVAKKRVAKSPSPVPVYETRRHENPYAHIAKSVGISTVVMTSLVLIFSPANVWILGPVIGAMAIFGIALGYFASK